MHNIAEERNDNHVRLYGLEIFFCVLYGTFCDFKEGTTPRELVKFQEERLERYEMLTKPNNIEKPMREIQNQFFVNRN